MSKHYDAEYFDRLEQRRDKEARRAREQDLHDHPWKTDSWSTQVFLIVVFFLALGGVLLIGGLLSGTIH
jgi:hypothetical protein